MVVPSKLAVQHGTVRGITTVMDLLANTIPSLLHRSRDNPMPNRPRWQQRTAGSEEPPESGKPSRGNSWVVIDSHHQRTIVGLDKPWQLRHCPSNHDVWDDLESPWG